MLIGLIVAALLSGCVPIGVRGSSVPSRGGASDTPSAYLHAAPHIDHLWGNSAIAAK
jgi:hypothetical protein